MSPYERYLFSGRCPYTNIPCYLDDIECVNCTVNRNERAWADEKDEVEVQDADSN